MIFCFLCLCPYLSSYLYSHLSSRQREYQQGQAGRTLLVSSLSQFKIKSIFHRSTPTQSHTPMFTKLNPNIYKWRYRRLSIHIPQNGRQDLLCTSSMHLTFNRAISKILFSPYFFILGLYCGGLAPCGGLNPADCRWHQHPPTTLSPFLLFGCCCVYLLCLFEFVPRCTGCFFICPSKRLH